MSPWLAGLLVFMALVAVVTVLYRGSSRFRKRLDTETKQREDKKKRRFGIDVGILIAIGKFIWGWRSAPEGSLEKLGWHLFVAAVIAFGIWVVLTLIDRRINGPDPAIARGYQSAVGDTS